MKRILSVLFILSVLSSSGQQPYLPSTDGTPMNKPVGVSGYSTDARSQFHDRTNFLWRDYRDTAEVRTTLTTSQHRKGNFIILVHAGGTLGGNGLYTGGTTEPWWYKDGQANSNLIQFAPGGGGSGTVTQVTSGNLLNFATVGVATNTTTPAFTFSLLQPTAHTFFGNNTGSTTAPAYVAIDTVDVAHLGGIRWQADGAYKSVVMLSDSSGFILERWNGTRDTIGFIGSGGTAGGDTTNVPIDGTLRNIAGVLGVAPASGTVLFKSVTITNSTYTVASGIAVVMCNYTGGTATITLPTTPYVDQRVTIQNRSTNNVSVTPVASGFQNTLVQYDTPTFQWNGTDWSVVSK